ncbi:MAG TPA: hypothetical protein VD838_04030, partial [Anaeromyxobacteraceae bacterium]|nr:hypothetical protein [Anaeromyxobacteraceae bacterium]
MRSPDAIFPDRGRRKPGIVTRQEFDYDEKGDVTAFRDFGDLADAADDLHAAIAYRSDDPAATDLYSVSRPESVEVFDRTGRILRSRSASYDSNGNLAKFRAPLGDGRTAETDFEWNTN